MHSELSALSCRHCQTQLQYVFADLQTCPLSNAMLNAEDLDEPEIYYPLKVFVCHHCFLVQAKKVEETYAIFNSNYTYHSSYVKTVLDHAKTYVGRMMDKFPLDKNSQVIEIASNDGYLIQYFQEKGIPVLGIDPAEQAAAVARSRGIHTISDFFSTRFATEELSGKGIRADLLIGNNVLAHVPDIDDFVQGLWIALKPNGIVTMEFPHLVKLIEERQFDTIYHEHFSYLSFTVTNQIFSQHQLRIFDVEKIPINGGSLRIYACHTSNKSYAIADNVLQLLDEERINGISTLAYYDRFQEKVNEVSYAFLDFLLAAKKQGKIVAAYGAAAKGNTLLNYCGIKGNDLIRYVVDASPYKQGKFLPGSRIPVVPIETIYDTPPDYILILPWNLKEEIEEVLAFTRPRGTKFVTALPELRIF